MYGILKETIFYSVIHLVDIKFKSHPTFFLPLLCLILWRHSCPIIMLFVISLFRITALSVGVIIWYKTCLSVLDVVLAIILLITLHSLFSNLWNQSNISVINRVQITSLIENMQISCCDSFFNCCPVFLKKSSW